MMTMNPPEWQMDDAYGDVDTPRWQASVDKARELTETLRGIAIERETYLQALSVYEEAVTITSSLTSFTRCQGAKNAEDERVPVAVETVTGLCADLNDASAPLFAALAGLDPEDPLWQEKPLSHWKFVITERMNDWHQKLPDADRAFYADIERSCLMPLGGLHKELLRQVDFPAQTADGAQQRVRSAKMIAVLKGVPDPVLRRTTAEGMDEFFGRNANLYAALLNQLHGIRLTAMKRAGVEPLDVSLAQNRMSREAFEAIREAIRRHLDTIRRTVTLRAPFMGEGPMRFEDLMAPCPQKTGRVAPALPYGEGIGIVKEALSKVNPEMGEFVDMMLEKRWIDAKPSDKKIGGAFYSRFNEFKIPRVFTTYLDSITSVFQQGHELGHAYHYWMMRDLPMIETEFPMTLTETASTFNEAVIRRSLFEKAEGDERFAMLWQELKSAANFLLQSMSRMEFELDFLEERKAGVVSAHRTIELMETAWKRMYGETATPDRWLWAYKLHFYKTDQLIYNYPYTVGYLMSLALMRELRVRGDAFYPFYKAMLRDTGRMTVDQIVERHFGADAKDPVFWENAMQSVFDSIEEFETLARARQA